MTKVLNKVKSFFVGIPTKVKNYFKSIPDRLKKKFAGAKEIITQGNSKVGASICCMGLGQLLYKQWTKGSMFILLQVAFILYFVFTGGADLFGLFTLGQVKGDVWFGIAGDNSVVMMLMGIFAVIMIMFYIAIYIVNVKDVYAKL